MSRNPFKPTKDQTTEFGWGAGRFPQPTTDFSQGGFKSRIPIADPDRRQQHMDLAAARRTDLQNLNEFPPPAFFGQSGSNPLHYKLGNTERFGANPPLVRERKVPDFPKEKPEVRHHTERAW